MFRFPTKLPPHHRGALACGLAALLLLGGVAPVQTLRAEPLVDHPLVQPYQGSTLRRSQVRERDQYQAFTGINPRTGKLAGKPLEGRVTRLFYDRPRDRSLVEIFRSYENGLRQAGAEILFQCDQAAARGCLKSLATADLQAFNGLQAMSPREGMYLLARLPRGEASAYVAIVVGGYFTDIHVVEVGADAPTAAVGLKAAALGRSLDTQGHAVLEGLEVEAGSAVLKPVSERVLAEVASLLKLRATLSVYVVGHSDASAGLESGRELSQARASAVVEALVQGHGIAAERLEAHGLGPLAPQASNADESGRSRNRRVVLVVR